MGHVALLLEPLQAGIVRVEFKGAVQKIWAENLQSVHDGEHLQEMRRVGPLRGGQLTRLVGDGMPGGRIVRLLKDRRNSQLRRVSSRAGSHTLNTGADIRAAWSCSKLRCSAAVHRNMAFGLHRLVSGLKFAKPFTNLR